MYCPKCNTVLLLSEKSGVEIDYCPSCRGIWLDRGELEKIIERNTAYNQNRYENHDQYRREHYDDDYYNHDDHHYNHKNKKRGFLSDLFDF